jgi:alkanesulfonate monooxygenase SsuD/methylene tetrahydromethanopterin reductase-like flavin-dependent oxidoreductase (luciferase family)
MPASSNPTHSRWIGRHGFNLMTLPWLQGFEVTRRVIADYREGLREGGFAENSRQVLSYLPAYVGETPDRAWKEAAEAWVRVREVSDEERGGPAPNAVPYDSLVEQSRLIVGDAATCRQHVQRICEEIPVDRLALSFHFGGLAQDVVLASMRRFATEVAPSFVS